MRLSVWSLDQKPLAELVSQARKEAGAGLRAALCQLTQLVCVFSFCDSVYSKGLLVLHLKCLSRVVPASIF